MGGSWDEKITSIFDRAAATFSFLSLDPSLLPLRASSSCGKGGGNGNKRVKYTHTSLSPTHSSSHVNMPHLCDQCSDAWGISSTYLEDTHTYTNSSSTRACLSKCTYREAIRTHTPYSVQHEWYAVTTQIKYSRNEKYEYRPVQRPDPTSADDTDYSRRLCIVYILTAHHDRLSRCSLEPGDVWSVKRAKISELTVTAAVPGSNPATVYQVSNSHTEVHSQPI